MKTLKQTLLAGFISATVAAPIVANAATLATPLPQFSAADTQLLFEQNTKPMQLAVLSPKEMKETEGAFWNFVAGGAVGFGWYAYNNWGNLTWEGSLLSAGTGALTGGVGGMLIRASGGGLAANLAWRPNMLATNFSFSQIRKYYGW